MIGRTTCPSLVQRALGNVDAVAKRNDRGEPGRAFRRTVGVDVGAELFDFGRLPGRWVEVREFLVQLFRFAISFRRHGLVFPVDNAGTIVNFLGSRNRSFGAPQQVICAS